MKIRLLIYIVFSCLLNASGQKYSIHISDNSGKQYSASEYDVTCDSVIIRGLSDYGNTQVEYIKRAVTKEEKKLINSVRKKYPTAGFAAEYFSDYSNFSYIAADHYPRVISISIVDKSITKDIKITNCYVSAIAPMINELNALFPAEVRITYRQEDYTKTY